MFDFSWRNPMFLLAMLQMVFFFAGTAAVFFFLGVWLG